MFLIDDDQSQIVERQADSRPYPEHKLCLGLIGQDIVPHLDPLMGRVFAMIDTHFVPEEMFQAVHQLYTETYFGNQVEDIFPLSECLLYELAIKERFARSCHPL